ncbi:hypothetical protein BS78_07G041200 [Paspalum vaginatum]|nr:hypothetical protein BS78_07G041200 [Paspalum vaginatum]
MAPPPTLVSDAGERYQTRRAVAPRAPWVGGRPRHATVRPFPRRHTRRHPPPPSLGGGLVIPYQQADLVGESSTEVVPAGCSRLISPDPPWVRSGSGGARAGRSANKLCVEKRRAGSCALV